MVHCIFEEQNFEDILKNLILYILIHQILIGGYLLLHIQF